MGKQKDQEGSRKRLYGMFSMSLTDAGRLALDRDRLALDKERALSQVIGAPRLLISEVWDTSHNRVPPKINQSKALLVLKCLIPA